MATAVLSNISQGYDFELTEVFVGGKKLAFYGPGISVGGRVFFRLCKDGRIFVQHDGLIPQPWRPLGNQQVEIPVDVQRRFKAIAAEKNLKLYPPLD